MDFTGCGAIPEKAITPEDTKDPGERRKLHISRMGKAP